MLNLFTKCLCIKSENDTSVPVSRLAHQKSNGSNSAERTHAKRNGTEIDENLPMDSPTGTTKSSTHLFPKSSDNYFRRGKSLSGQEKWDIALKNYEKFIASRKGESKEEDGEIAEAYHQMGKIFELKYDFEDALASFQKSYEIRAKLYGKNHLETIESGILVGDMYSRLLMDSQAELYYKAGLEYYQQDSTFYYIEVPELNLKLGKIYQERGDFEIAVKYLQTALNTKLQSGDKDQLDVVKFYDALGLLFCRMNAFDKAYSYINTGLQIRLKRLDSKDPFVATSYNNLSIILCGQGKYDEALNAAKSALDIYIANYGDSHLIVTNTYDSIALVYKNQDKFEEAIDYCLKSQAIRTKSYSADVPPSDLAKTYHILGEVYFKTGRIQEALKFFRTALEIRMNHSPTHPDIIEYYRTIALIYESGGSYDKAVEYLIKTAVKHKEKYGDDNRELADMYNHLGTVYLRTKEYEHARSFFEKAYLIYCRFDLDKIKPELADCLRDISLSLAYKRQFEEALNYINRTIELLSNEEKNIRVAGCYSNKGTYYYWMNRLAEAAECFNKGMSLYEKTKTEPDKDFMIMLNNLGNIYFSQKNYKQAISYYDKSIKVKIEVYNEDHASLWGSYNNIALGFLMENNITLALDYFTKSLRIAVRCFGEEFEGLKVLYYNIGELSIRMLEYSKALTSFKKSLEISLNCTEEDNNFDMYILYYKIGECYSKQDKATKAIECYKKCIQMLKSINEKDNYWTELQDVYLKYLALIKKVPKADDPTKFIDELNLIKEKIQLLKKQGKQNSSHVVKHFRQEIIEVQEYHYSMQESEYVTSNSLESSQKSQKLTES